MHPPKIQSLQHVSGGLVKFQAIMKDWINVGGETTDQELKNDLMEVLPAEIREALMWRAHNSPESFQGFVNHVRATAEDILFLRGQTSLPTNAVMADPQLQAKPNDPEDDESYDDAIAAINQRFKGRGKGNRKGREGNGERPPREDKCGNCGGRPPYG